MKKIIIFIFCMITVLSITWIKKSEEKVTNINLMNSVIEKKRGPTLIEKSVLKKNNHLALAPKERVEEEKYVATHEELMQQFDRYSDDELEKLEKEVGEKIDKSGLIVKANHGELTKLEMNMLEQMMREQESIALLKASRIVKNMDS